MELLQNSQPGSVLVGAISYGKVSNAGQDIGKSPTKNPASYQISYIVPPNKVAQDHPNFCFFFNAFSKG